MPSPLVPSLSRSKTSDDKFPSKPLAQNKAWKVGVSTSTTGSSTRTFFPLSSFFWNYSSDPTDSPEPSPSRSQARTPHFHMYPLLSYTHLHHAPISYYDIAFTPSARTVVDRTVHSSLPASSRLVLRSPKLPWVVTVGPIGSPLMFFISKDGEKRKRRARPRSQTSTCSTP